MIFVKKLVSLTTLSCATLCAVLSFGTVAFAEAAQPVYPENFTKNLEDRLNDVSDFAIADNEYALADGNKIVVLKNNGVSEYDIGSKVMALDCVTDETETVFYYKNGDGETFSLPEKTPAEHNFPESGTRFQTADGDYKLSENGEVRFCPLNEFEFLPVKAEGVVFSVIKNYSDTVYGLSGNSLYSFNRTSATKTELSYTDFSAAETIAVGDTAAKLSNYNVETLHYVALSENAFLTEVNLDELNGPYFKTGTTLKVGASDGPSVGKTALLLCKTGANDDVSIVMYGGKAYILRTENTSETVKQTLTEPDFEKATVSIAAGHAYSSPFVCNGTKLFAIKSGDTVDVLGKVTTVSSPEIIRDFYLVEYKDENGTHKGYVPFGYISKYNYAENPPTEIPDKDFTTDDLVKTVVLVLVVVVLVLTAVGYITYIATSGKKKKAGRKDD